MDTTPNLAETMEAERQRLTKVLEGIAQKRIELDQEERTAQIELHGISAYLDAKLNRVAPQSSATPAPKKRTPGAPRGPRQTGIKERILAVMTQEPISKQDILTKLEAGDDKAMNQAISNSLVALKASNKIISGARGMYQLPPAPAEAAPVPPKRVKKEEAPAS